MTCPRISVAALAVALAACQQAPETGTANAINMAAPADVVTLPPDESMIPPEDAIANHGAPGNDAAPSGTIPAAFRGRWGMVPADCTSTRGDAKGLLIIGDDTLQFYESRATLTKVIGDYPEKLVGEFAFIGEGQEWTRTETLELTGSSNTLIRSEKDPPGRFTYKRCDA